jgi:choline kinase
MKIVILAAGTGSRLGPLTRNTPKSLLDLGHGLTLLETQLNAIKRSGIREVVLVTGYLSEQIEAKIQAYDDFDFEVVYNPFFDSSNNLVSAWMAMPYVSDSFVIVNGDDVFRPEVLERLLVAKGNAVMVVSQKDSYDEDDMKVHTVGDSVQKVSKDLSAEEANGESIGMIKFSQTGREWFFGELDQAVRGKAALDWYYLRALQNMMDDGLSVNYSLCKPNEWAEIDFHPDLVTIKERLSRELLP